MDIDESKIVRVINIILITKYYQNLCISISDLNLIKQIISYIYVGNKDNG